MNGEERLLELECELAAMRIRIAELELDVIALAKAERRTSSEKRRLVLDPAKAAVDQLAHELAENAKSNEPIREVNPIPEPKTVAPVSASSPPRPQSSDRHATPAKINVQEIWPEGSDLENPRSFGLKPPINELDPHGGSREEYQRRLTQHLAFATRVLHTSGVVAVVWREWRAFERSVQEKLRTLNAAPPSYAS